MESKSPVQPIVRNDEQVPVMGGNATEEHNVTIKEVCLLCCMLMRKRKRKRMCVLCLNKCLNVLTYLELLIHFFVVVLYSAKC